MNESPAIMLSHHPATVLRVINPIMRLLLSFAGRKTGRPYSIPVNSHRIDGDLYALTDAPWKQNFRGGATAQVVHDGKTTSMHGELVEDRAVVADVYRRCAQSCGDKDPQRTMGLKFRDKRIPSTEDFAEAVDRLGLSAIRFRCGGPRSTVLP
ncbi:hypothetical protein [Mycobacterium kyorinense]|uniref:DUF385 domain-containing protein n=1 Tax=Mycobacterium kyorinense TaxID=487514 RepID=A0A1X1XGV9_9MYCO|nr:hypothetical protein [Mycobacterium kyorinense]ORV98072.1 hypothetical protein AWC14_14120 [Mycobacterium kyorinense]